MYEEFGAREKDNTETAEFKLFIPDEAYDPSQYEGGGLPQIKEVRVVGDFFPTPIWNGLDGLLMEKTLYKDKNGLKKGWLYSAKTSVLKTGFYQYKYSITFENGKSRLINDPCCQWGGPAASKPGEQPQTSGFTIGGHKIDVPKYLKPVPAQDLIIYELMIDDFTKNLPVNNRSSLKALLEDKLDYLVDLGVNAIEFMPWTAWPTDAFSWGYNPFQYFSVAHQYADDPTTPADKIFYLNQLIEACHSKGISVIMDGVFNHVEEGPEGIGFAYYWLYEDTADSPFVGNFADHAFFKDLDYANRCTLEFIRDVCFYWIDIFQIDGIRFDNTLGFYKADDRGHGLPKLLTELRGDLSAIGKSNFFIAIEHSWDYAAIDVTNKVGATSCWYDNYRQLCARYLGSRQIDTQIMRMLNSAKDFAPGRVPTIYVENHDHEAFVLKAGGRHNWGMTQPYLIGLFTCAGALLIHNGQEFGEDYWMPEEGAERVRSRPLRWDRLEDEPGQKLLAFYKQLIKMRKDHVGLRASNFYPDSWDEKRTTLNEHGFGIDVGRQIVVYHRWGQADDGKLEKFYIVLNFSDQQQYVDLDLPEDDGWEDLISGWKPQVKSNHLQFNIGSNWGHVFYKKYA